MRVGHCSFAVYLLLLGLTCLAHNIVIQMLKLLFAIFSVILRLSSSASRACRRAEHHGTALARHRGTVGVHLLRQLMIHLVHTVLCFWSAFNITLHLLNIVRSPLRPIHAIFLVKLMKLSLNIMECLGRGELMLNVLLNLCILLRLRLVCYLMSVRRGRRCFLKWILLKH